MPDKEIQVQKASDQEVEKDLQSTLKLISGPAKQFYEEDVIPRAKRERSFWQRWSLETPKWLDTPITMGSQDRHSLDWNTNPGVSGFYSPRDRDIHLRPINTKSSTLVHEMTHANQNLDVVDTPQDFVKHGIVGVILRSFRPDYKQQHITKKEKGLLEQAYQTDNDSQTKDSSLLIEKHASNRELRYVIWCRLREQLGRNPTLEETDAYIKQMTNEELESLQYTNDYIYDYMHHPNYNSYDVKTSLIHVAKGNTPSSQNQRMYARSGGRVNYLNMF